MENNLVAIKQQKQTVWGKFGIALVDAENDLQTKKMVILNGLPEPKKEGLKESEAHLKNAKSLEKELVNERKKITDPLDNVKSRLMEVEKSVSLQIKEYEHKIIKIKSEIEAEEKQKNAKSEEIKTFISKLNSAYIDLEDWMLKFANKHTNEIYFKILDADIPYDDFDLNCEIAITQLTENNVLPTIKEAFAKQNYKPLLITMDEIKNLSIENKKEVTNPYLLISENLKSKKIGYKSELANKEMAKELAMKEQKEAEKKREEEKQRAELEAKIEQATEMQLTEKSDIKALKKCYEVEMPDTYQTALQLFATFSSNLDLVLPKLKVNKWFAFTPQQIANVLGRLKTENNSLEFSGITFKEVSKL